MKKDSKSAACSPSWQAAKSGHWFGSMEKGMSQLEEGITAARWIANRVCSLSSKPPRIPGHGEASSIPRHGVRPGLRGKENMVNSPSSSPKPPFRQGDPSAASVLGFVYSEGIGRSQSRRETSPSSGAAKLNRPGLGVSLMEEKARAQFLQENRRHRSFRTEGQIAGSNLGSSSVRHKRAHGGRMGTRMG